MTLTNRFSIFLLGVLSVVLIGFSSTLYFLARSYLYRELDDRLKAELDTLTAAAEIKTPQLLEWEPEKHHLSTGLDARPEYVRWIVRERNNHIVDQSKNLTGAPEWKILLAATAIDPAPAPTMNEDPVPVSQPPDWRLQTRRLLPSSPGSEPESSSRTGRKRVYPELVMSVALSTKPVEQTLQALLSWSCFLSLLLWLTTAFACRWLCNRALRPLHRMAMSARELPATELHRRIPLPGTRDELDELGAAFNELLGRAQVAMECQQRFASQASHQLRTPLATLLGHLQLALRRERTSEEYRRTISRAEAKGQQMSRIIEALLFLTREETKGSLLQVAEIDLAELISRYMDKWTGHERYHDIIVQIPETPIRVVAHQELLCQAFDNLLENACKYSSSGSPIRVIVNRNEQTAKLLVEDSGFGIAPEDMDHLFEPFFRAQQAREQGIVGTGLGLSVTKRIASALSGSIRVQSSLGHGSVFTLELPSLSTSTTASS